MAEQLFQIGIKGITRNDKNEILLVSTPEWGGNLAYWDLPGGRMDAGETFEQTLARELMEEIGVTYIGKPKFVTTILSNITIPVGEMRVPLVLMAYEVLLPADAEITPGEDNPTFEWVSASVAAKRLQNKYPVEFCERIKSS